MPPPSSPPVPAPPLVPPPAGAAHADSTDHIDGVPRRLRLKRAEINAEIAAFRRQKEAEYVRFEQELVAKAIGLERRAESPTAAALAAAALPSTLPKDETNEEELRALFNPSFLPLLEAGPSSSATTSSKTSESDLTKASSSSTLPSSTYRPPSPSASTSQASSAPRPSLHHRRSSSRSDASPSLRSSLKASSAKSEERGRSPKAAKHVLFHIDGGVIAPSSSPAVSRRTEGVPTSPTAQQAGTSQPAESVSENVPATAKAPPLASAASSSKTNISISTAIAEPAPLPNLPSTPPIRTPTSPSSAAGKNPGMIESYALLDTSTPTPVTPGESEEFDLAAGGADPLFDLDDEGPPPPLPEDELLDDTQLHQSSAAQEPDGRAVATAPQEQAPAHAGSVPIEIKWPGRK